MRLILPQDDIPFGARALEQGFQIEGIWVSNPNSPVPSPHQPGTPSESRPSTPKVKSLQIPGSVPGLLSTIEKAPSNHSNHSSLPPYTLHPVRPEAEVVAVNRYTYEPQRPGGIRPPVMASSVPNSPTKFKRRSEAFHNHAKRSSFHNRLVRTSQLFDPRPRTSPVGLGEPGAQQPGPMDNGIGAHRPVEQHRVGRMTSKSQPWPH